MVNTRLWKFLVSSIVILRDEITSYLILNSKKAEPILEWYLLRCMFGVCPFDRIKQMACKTQRKREKY